MKSRSRSRSSESSGFSSSSASPPRRRVSPSPPRHRYRDRDDEPIRRHSPSQRKSPKNERRGRSQSPERRRSRSSSYSRSRSPVRRHEKSPSPHRSPSPPRYIIKVIGLSRNVTKDHVNEIFNNPAPILKVVFPVNDATGYGRGYAFVEYSSEEDAQKAIRFMNGGQLDGNIIECCVGDSVAMERELRPSSRSSKHPEDHGRSSHYRRTRSPPPRFSRDRDTRSYRRY